MRDLPEFKTVPESKARGFIAHALTRGPRTSLVDIESFDDGHFRAVFRKDFFALAEDRTEPSKSQWNTLKKHIKRVNRNVFIFKEHGEADAEHYYIDFGFFAE